MDSATVARRLNATSDPTLVRPLGNGHWEAVDDRDSDRAARNLNVAGGTADKRRQHVRGRRYQRKVLDRGR
jgi:hypothetical protein